MSDVYRSLLVFPNSRDSGTSLGQRTIAFSADELTICRSYIFLFDGSLSTTGWMVD